MFIYLSMNPPGNDWTLETLIWLKMWKIASFCYDIKKIVATSVQTNLQKNNAKIPLKIQLRKFRKKKGNNLKKIIRNHCKKMQKNSLAGFGWTYENWQKDAELSELRIPQVVLQQQHFREGFRETSHRFHIFPLNSFFAKKYKIYLYCI